MLIQPVPARGSFIYEDDIMSSSVSTERAAMASRSPGPALVFAMALSCGLAVANI